MGSSRLLEYLVALTVGVLAVLGALLCIGFLLVEPIRSPPSEGPTVSLADLLSEDCEPEVQERRLPQGCTLGGRQFIPVASCSLSVCPCNEDLLRGTSICCCRDVEWDVINAAIDCPMEGMVPLTSNATQCSCVACDDLEITVTLDVRSAGSNNPIIAARVFRMDSRSELTFLGITNNFGIFRYRDVAGSGPVVYRIQASGYLTQSTAAVNLLPSRPSVRREVVLMPSMNIEVGLGGAPLILRLGTMLSVSSQPSSFINLDGEVYEDMVTFRGGVVEVEDEAARATIPEVSLEYTDPQTGEVRPFTFYVGLMLDFVDRSGQPLRNPTGLSITTSVVLAEEDAGVMLMTFDPFLGVWNKTTELSETAPFRKKKQIVNPCNPVFFEGEDSDLGFFQVIAANGGVDCFLQARVFGADGVTPPPTTTGAVVTIQQFAFVNDQCPMPILIQFVGETNLDQTDVDGLVFNALCLPTACNVPIVESVLVASDSATDERLLPVDFADTVFENVPTPIVLSTAFLFTEVETSEVNDTRPFYSSVFECAEAGARASDVAEPSEYFSFREATGSELQSPGLGDECFIKILVNDCFGTNQVMVSSINVNSGTTVTFMEEIPLPPFDVPTTPPMTSDLPTTDATTMFTTMPPTTGTMSTEDTDEGSGTTEMMDMTTVTDTPTTTMDTTTPDDTTTTEGPTEPFVCNADTATVRGACLPYTCGDNIRVLVLPNVTNSVGEFCVVTSLATTLQSSPFIANIDLTDQLNINSVVNPNQMDLELQLLFSSDFNDPNLGLYADLISGENPMGGDFALERCNAGMGEEFMSDTINLDQGYAAIFSCFEP